MNNNIIQLFLKSAELHPHKTAIVDKHGQITFYELQKKIVQKAYYFKCNGIQKGDRVLIFIPMNIELYINVLALFYIGATAVFLDEWVNVERLKVCCKLADCKAIIAGWKIRLLRLLIKPLRDIPVFLQPSKEVNGTIECNNVATSDTALITFTTGSTGIPKATNRTHYFLQAQFKALLPLLNAEIDLVDMPMLPIVLLLNLGIGRTSIVADFTASKPNSFDASIVAKQIINKNVQRITASPFYLLQLADYCKQNNFVLPLQKVLAGGSAVFPKDALLLCIHLCKQTTIVYGSTEAEPIAHCMAEHLVDKYRQTNNGLFVGEVDSSADVQIIEYTTTPIDARLLDSIIKPIGIFGEIIVSGQHVLNSYFKNEQAFIDNKIIDNNNILWHRTGDMGYINTDNQLFLLGRCKQAIVQDGNMLFPFIVEDALNNIDGVEAGTILKLNNKIHIIVQAVVNENIMQAITNFCKQQSITNHQIHFETIPRDARHNSKIDYEKLAVLIGKKLSKI